MTCHCTKNLPLLNVFFKHLLKVYLFKMAYELGLPDLEPKKGDCLCNLPLSVILLLSCFV